MTTGLPVVSTVHGFIGGDAKGRVYEWLQRRTLARFDAVVVVSRDLRDELREAGVDAPRLHLIRNAWAGGQELLERSEARRRLGLDSEAFVVGWVGRLSPEKGPDLLLRALARVADPNLRASVVGEGGERTALERLSRELGVEGRVRFHGMVPGAAALYRAFDVFVLSSRTEGTPVSLLEAMHASVPVVATSVGGVPDVVGRDEALLVPPGEPGKLADAIREVRARPGPARERARRARGRLGEAFDSGRWLDRYDAVYRAVTAAR